MAKNHKLLYISWIIAPAKGGSSYITHQLAKHFNRDTMVIAGGSNKKFKGRDSYDGVEYNYFFTELSWKGHGNQYFTLFRWLLFPFLVFNLFRLAKKEKPDAILASFPDGYYLFAAWIIAKYGKLNLFTYYHNTFVENRKGFSKWFADKIQNRIFKRSKSIFTISEGLNDYFKNAYPVIASKLHVLPHTFEKYPVRISVETYSQAPPYKLVLIGTLNHSNMEATKRVLNLISKSRDLYALDIFTPIHKNVLKYKWGLDLDVLGIKHCGYVLQEEVNEVISNYDACILTHGFTGGYTSIEYQTIFPTRMIPLLLSGKPILVHSPENSFLNQFIRNYDCAELVSTRKDEDLSKALERITTDRDRIQHLVENANKASRYFYGPDIIKSLMSVINRG